jgi:hypothetical protein
MAGVLPRRNWGLDLMFLLMLAVALFAALFVVVLPLGILLVAFVVCHRKTDEPELRLCFAADVTDPAAKPCFTPEGTRYCDRHQALEQAS